MKPRLPLSIAATVLQLGAQGAGAAPADPGHSCVVEPARTAEIRSPVPGLITRILAVRGDLVHADQVLVVIDTKLEQAGADIAQQRAQMEGAEHVATARLEYARLKAQRQQQLAQEKYVSANERDAAVAEMQVAAAELADARENRQLAKLEHKRMTESVKQRTVKAPFNAVVTERTAQPGEVAVMTESARPLLKLADLSVLHVEALLPASMWKSVRVGQTLKVQLDSSVGGSTHDARVNVVDRVLDAASGTFGVRLELPNPQLKLPAGVRCKVST